MTASVKPCRDRKARSRVKPLPSATGFTCEAPGNRGCKERRVRAAILAARGAAQLPMEFRFGHCRGLWAWTDHVLFDEQRAVSAFNACAESRVSSASIAAAANGAP